MKNNATQLIRLAERCPICGRVGVVGKKNSIKNYINLWRIPRRVNIVAVDKQEISTKDFFRVIFGFSLSSLRECRAVEAEIMIHERALRTAEFMGNVFPKQIRIPGLP